MDNSERLSILKDRHARLDKEITEMIKEGSFSDEQVINKKKEKLSIKDEIRRLEKVVWEENHETLRWDDDR